MELALIDEALRDVSSTLPVYESSDEPSISTTRRDTSRRNRNAGSSRNNKSLKRSAGNKHHRHPVLEMLKKLLVFFLIIVVFVATIRLVATVATAVAMEPESDMQSFAIV